MHSLTSFFIGVAIALIIVLCVTFFIRGGVKFSNTVIFVAGFLVGMVTLYIKVKMLGF